MSTFAGKTAFVLGRDSSGEAAAGLLRRRGSRVEWLTASTGAVPGPSTPDVVVVSAGQAGDAAEIQRWRDAGVPVIGERELAFQESLCLHVAVTGASGTTTTASLVAHLLRSSGRRVEVADAEERPASAMVEVTRDLDFLVHAVSLPELDLLEYFRPVVGVILNLPGESADWTPSSPPAQGFLGGFARLFGRQQAFDWIIIQSEALARMQSVGLNPPGKRITFSAASRRADLGVDHGLLVSRMEGWAGLLWDMARSPLGGMPVAEDMLAGLAAGRVLRLKLDEMSHSLGSWMPGPGRLECLGEADGVRFYDDSRSANPEALSKALTSLAPHPPEQPFIWLIAGDERPGRPAYDLGPLLSPRVKQVYLVGEGGVAMRGAWGLFAPCSVAQSLSDATERALGQARKGDAILYSPACPGSANLTARQQRGEAFRYVVRGRLGHPHAERACPVSVPVPPADPAPRRKSNDDE